MSRNKALIVSGIIGLIGAYLLWKPALFISLIIFDCKLWGVQTNEFCTQDYYVGHIIGILLFLIIAIIIYKLIKKK